MTELYPNTTILDIPRAGSAATPPEFIHHSIYGVPIDVILPVCVILFVVWYFQGRPELKIYAVALAIAYAVLPTWVVIVLAIMFILLDRIEQYFKKKHEGHITNVIQCNTRRKHWNKLN